MTCFWAIFVTLMLPVEVRHRADLRRGGRGLGHARLLLRLDRADHRLGHGDPFCSASSSSASPTNSPKPPRVDGASPMRFFWDILLPMSRTTIAALFVIQFI